MKIYTKTGDSGETGIQGNVRMSKSHPRIIAYGSVDEANATLGVVLSNDLDNELKEILVNLQNELFVVGADLSNPDTEDDKNRVTSEMVKNLETLIDKYEQELEPLTNFILPGGQLPAAQIHFCRTIVRRAETQIVLLAESDKVNGECIRYMNRLSDLLFVLGRVLNKRRGIKDRIWKI